MSTDTYNPPVTVLSKDDVAALRKAVVDASHERSYVLNVRHDTSTASPEHYTGTATITLSKEVDLGEGYDPRWTYERREIAAAPGVENFAHREYGTLIAATRHYKSSATSPLNTLASLVKPGDWLRVRFTLGNDTETMRTAGLTHDECYIIVMRGKKLVGSVLVDQVIAPTHSLSLFNVRL